MKSERQKMLDGELYNALDAELVAARAHAPDGVFAAGNPCRVIREITE
jgi:Maltose acetyltransferase